MMTLLVNKDWSKVVNIIRNINNYYVKNVTRVLLLLKITDFVSKK